MLKSFCDVCGNESDDGVPHRHEHLTGVDSKRIGLELIPLREGKPAQNFHVCGDCMLNLMWEMARQCPSTGLARRIEQLDAQMRRVDRLDEQEKAIGLGKRTILQKNDELNKQRATLEAEKKAVENRIPALQRQIEDLKAETDAKARRIASEAKTAFIQANRRISDDLDRRAAKIANREVELSTRTQLLSAQEDALKRRQTATAAPSEDVIEGRINNALLRQRAEHEAEIAALNARLHRINSEIDQRVKDAAKAERAAVVEANRIQAQAHERRQAELDRQAADYRKNVDRLNQVEALLAKREAEIKDFAGASLAELASKHANQIAVLQAQVDHHKSLSAQAQRQAAAQARQAQMEDPAYIKRVEERERRRSGG